MKSMDEKHDSDSAATQDTNVQILPAIWASALPNLLRSQPYVRLEAGKRGGVGASTTIGVGLP